MTYQETVVEMTKIACEELVNRVQEAVNTSDCIISTKIDMTLTIPTLTDNPQCLPEFTVAINSYPRRIACDRIIETYLGKEL